MDPFPWEAVLAIALWILAYFLAQKKLQRLKLMRFYELSKLDSTFWLQAVVCLLVIGGYMVMLLVSFFLAAKEPWLTMWNTLLVWRDLPMACFIWLFARALP